MLEMGGGEVGGNQQAVRAVNQHYPTLSKITYSTPGFPSSLPQATLLSTSRFRRVCVCVLCCVLCCMCGREEGRGGEGRVLLRSPGSLPTAPRGEEVTGPGRHSPMTSNALLTPVCEEGHHTLPPPAHLTPCHDGSPHNTLHSLKMTGEADITLLLLFNPFQTGVFVQLWQTTKKSSHSHKQNWTEISYSSFLMSCLSS